MKTPDPAFLVRTAMQCNAAFSALSGVTSIVASYPIAQWIGLRQPAVIGATGISLLVFAVALFATSRRKSVRLVDAWTAVALDTAWVIGSGIVVFSGVLNTRGNWLVTIIADIVLVFAILQYAGIRRLRRSAIVHS